MKGLAQGVSRLRLALKPCALVESITCCVLKAGFDRGQRDLKGLLCPGVVTRGYSSYGEIGSRARKLGAMGNFPRPPTEASVPAPVPALPAAGASPAQQEEELQTLLLSQFVAISQDSLMPAGNSSWDPPPPLSPSQPLDPGKTRGGHHGAFT